MAPQNKLANIIDTIATGSSYRTNQGAALERHCITGIYRFSQTWYLLTYVIIFHSVILIGRGRHATVLLVVFTLQPN